LFLLSRFIDSYIDAHIDAVDEFGTQKFVPENQLRKTATTYTDELGTVFTGCRVAGNIDVSKIKGNLHCAPGAVTNFAGSHVHNVNPYNMKADLEKFKAEHEIHRLAFGESFSGMKNPLDGYVFKTNDLVRHSYFLELVPTQYVTWGGARVLHTHQYQVTNYTEILHISDQLSTLPGIFFRYDFSPMLVRLESRSKSILHLLVKMCAIVGGVWTVIGLVFAVLRTTIERAKKLNR